MSLFAQSAKPSSISSVELELRFLRHLAWRAHYYNGVYLSARDLEALEFLNSQHSQDVSTTSVENFAVEEFQELNPHINVVSNETR